MLVEEVVLTAGEVPRDGPFPNNWLESTYRSSGEALMFDYNQVTGGFALESPAVGREEEDGSVTIAFGGTPLADLNVIGDAIAHREPPSLRHLQTCLMETGVNLSYQMKNVQTRFQKISC